MKLNTDKCIGCGRCVIICPVQAIKIIDKKAVVDKDLCVECSTCIRSAGCPVNAIKHKRLKWPRLVRNPFSDVIATHRLTGIPGRGTEEMKTNDVTNRFGRDEVGFSIEVGRPGVGTRIGTIVLITTKLSEIGVEYEKASPITALFIDDSGHIRDDVKNERVLSVIIEFKVHITKVEQILNLIKEIESQIDTVFTVGMITRFNMDGSIPILDLLTKNGFNPRPNAKINLGLGRATL
ncbi:MAG: DUF362 domain-containing protein [Candidatus Helarchaeota archaeon]